MLMIPFVVSEVTFLAGDWTQVLSVVSESFFFFLLRFTSLGSSIIYVDIHILPTMGEVQAKSLWTTLYWE